MDQALISEFIVITQCKHAIACKYLEVCKWDVASAVERYFENPHLFDDLLKTGPASSAEEVPEFNGEDSEYVREPMKQVRTRLVQEDVAVGRGIRRKGTHQATEAFRDLREEQMLQFGRAPRNKKAPGLADLFRPPLDLIFKGSMEKAKEKAIEDCKYLVVNVQDPSIFDCQVLNRDTWSNVDLKSLISQSFILIQLYHMTDPAAEYTTWYKTSKMPHIAILDPKTGERLWYNEGYIDAPSLRKQLKRILEEHPYEIDALLSHHEPNEGKTNSPWFELSEEQQLALVIRASLKESSNNTTDQKESQKDATKDAIGNPSLSDISSEDFSTDDDDEAGESPSRSKKRNFSSTTKPGQDNVEPTAKRKKLLESDSPEELSDADEITEGPYECTLQIRLPGGACIQEKFRGASKLSVVHKFVKTKLPPKTAFAISTPYPRRVFSQHDLMHMTIKEASLVPRAVIVIEQL